MQIKSVLINIARLNLCRTIWHKFSNKYSDEECYAAFVAAMNAQAKEWGMVHTNWINPSGLGEFGAYSKTAANDLSEMALHTFAIGGGGGMVQMVMK